MRVFGLITLVASISALFVLHAPAAQPPKPDESKNIVILPQKPGGATLNSGFACS